jgi:hypothetical protein
MNKGLIVTKKIYNLDYYSVPGVVLVRSAPTTFHNLLWTTLLRFNHHLMQLFHRKRHIAKNKYAPFTKNRREIVTIQKKEQIWGHFI